VVSARPLMRVVPRNATTTQKGGAMPRMLVTYATKKGSTKEVAEAVALRLGGHGIVVELQPAADVTDLDGYDGVVLGGAIYMGRLHADARTFLKRFRDQLAQMPVAVFAMGPLKMEPKDVTGSRTQLDHALGKTPEITPVAVTIFGGVVVPDKLRFPFSKMPATDARDWEAIRDWADEVAERVSSEVPAPA
jgi:menaquinone-dependent protoporphyrinogen oxidase